MYKLVVLLSVAAMAAAKPGYVAPLAYGALPVASSYSTGVVHGGLVPSVYSSPAVLPASYGAVYGYGLSQAPHSPAVVLDAVNGVPLDTPEVVAARAAHFQAKALSGHHIGKRSVSYVSPVSSLAYSAPVVSPYSSLVTPYSSVVSPYSTVVGAPVVSALAPRAYSVHPW